MIQSLNHVSNTELFLLFTHDIVLVALTISDLENQINNLEQTSRNFGLTVNAKQAKPFVFR